MASEMNTKRKVELREPMLSGGSVVGYEDVLSCGHRMSVLAKDWNKPLPKTRRCRPCHIAKNAPIPRRMPTPNDCLKRRKGTAYICAKALEHSGKHQSSNGMQWDESETVQHG